MPAPNQAGRTVAISSATCRFAVNVRSAPFQIQEVCFPSDSPMQVTLAHLAHLQLRISVLPYPSVNSTNLYRSSPDWLQSGRMVQKLAPGCVSSRYYDMSLRLFE